MSNVGFPLRPVMPGRWAEESHLLEAVGGMEQHWGTRQDLSDLISELCGRRSGYYVQRLNEG
jgi:hypothetical protein